MKRSKVLSLEHNPHPPAKPYRTHQQGGGGGRRRQGCAGSRANSLPPPLPASLCCQGEYRCLSQGCMYLAHAYPLCLDIRLMVSALW